MIGACVVIAVFIVGTAFGYCIGKNGAVVIGGSQRVQQAEKKEKKTVEQQWEDMMSYDGKNRKDE